MYNRVKHQVGKEMNDALERQIKVKEQQRKIAETILRDLTDEGLTARIEECGSVYDVRVSIDDSDKENLDAIGIVRVFSKSWNSNSTKFQVKYLQCNFTKSRNDKRWIDCHGRLSVISAIEQDMKDYYTRRYDY